MFDSVSAISCGFGHLTVGIIFFLKAILTNDVDNRAVNYISFFHQKFQRGKPDLLADIKRLVIILYSTLLKRKCSNIIILIPDTRKHLTFTGLPR